MIKEALLPRPCVWGTVDSAPEDGILHKIDMADQISYGLVEDKDGWFQCVDIEGIRLKQPGEV